MAFAQWNTNAAAQQNYYAGPSPPQPQPQLAAGGYAPPAAAAALGTASTALANSTLQPHYGPFLRYINTDLATKVYYGSILLVTRDAQPPALTISVGRVDQPLLLDQYGGYHFFRYGFNLPLPPGKDDAAVTYAVMGRSYTFVVAGAQNQCWRWAFYSCNGFSLDVSEEDRRTKHQGERPVWNDLFERHKAKPYHVQVGGGDQIYCDEAFVAVSDLKQFTALKTLEQKERMAASPDVVARIDAWYFGQYAKLFGFGPTAEAMTRIPYAFILDDHDIFDGWGSYGDRIQNMPIVRAVGQSAFRFYLLFQQHTTAQLAASHGFFGKIPRSYITYLGDQQALLFPDDRAERDLNRIRSRETDDMIFQRLHALAPSVRQLVIVMGIPIVYPRLGAVDAALDSISTGGMFQKVGSLMHEYSIGKVLNHFGVPELQDDLNDHWTSKGHEVERREFVERLQDFARQRKVRVSFIAGDVHLCCAGKFYSKGGAIPPAQDPNYMVQIVSSAIVNIPPPSAVVKMLQTNAKVYSLNDKTDEDTFTLFSINVEDERPRDMSKFYNRRNFCGVEPTADGGLSFTLYVEKKSHVGTKAYQIPVVPPLLI